MTKQSKMASFIEANINTAIGFVVSALLCMHVVPVIFPELDPLSDLSTAIELTMLFTVTSIARNYVVRRLSAYWDIMSCRLLSYWSAK